MNAHAKNFWYVPDRRIRTPRSAQKAAELAGWITAGTGTGDGAVEKPGEQELFAAMHTCAFQINRCNGKGKPAAAREHAKWVRRWQAIREYIVEQNLGLVYSTIRRFGAKNIDEHDLLSDAMLALSRAIERFNPWKGFRFSTYACNVIVRSLMRRGRTVSNYRRLFPLQHDATFERPEEIPDGQRELYVERLKRIMEGNLGNLTDLEQRILKQRFPADEHHRRTFQKIGDEIGLSKERVRQIQNVALRKLRHMLDEDLVLR